MLPRWSLTILLAGVVSCGSARQRCVNALPAPLGSFEGYAVSAGDDGAVVVHGKGALPWRVLYASPRNCTAPGGGSGNPMLLALLGRETVEMVDADGCGEEEVVVTSESVVPDLARRVGDFLGRHGLKERVAIRTRCAAQRR